MNRQLLKVGIHEKPLNKIEEKVEALKETIEINADSIGELFIKSLEEKDKNESKERLIKKLKKVVIQLFGELWSHFHGKGFDE